MTVCGGIDYPYAICSYRGNISYMSRGLVIARYPIKEISWACFKRIPFVESQCIEDIGCRSGKCGFSYHSQIPENFLYDSGTVRNPEFIWCTDVFHEGFLKMLSWYPLPDDIR